MASRLLHHASASGGSRTDEATSPGAGVAGYCRPGLLQGRFRADAASGKKSPALPRRLVNCSRCHARILSIPVQLRTPDSAPAMLTPPAGELLPMADGGPEQGGVRVRRLRRSAVRQGADRPDRGQPAGGDRRRRGVAAGSLVRCVRCAGIGRPPPFTAEYVARLLCARKPLRCATSFFSAVDPIAVLPTRRALLFPEIHALIDARVLRLLRVLPSPN